MAEIQTPNSFPKLSFVFKLGSLLSILALLLGFLVFNIFIPGVIKYLAFNIFYVILPGYFLVKLLRVNTSEKASETVVYSIAFGIAITIISYYFCYLSGFRIGLYFIGPILSLAALAHLVKNEKFRDFKKTITFDHGLFFIVSSILFLSFLGLSLRNLPPDMTGISSIYQDLLWTIGNTDSLTRSFPVFDSRFSGLELNYHYFVFIFRSVTSYVTGISSERLFFVYSPFLMLPFLVLSIYVFAQTVFNNINKSTFFVWTFLFTGCASMMYLFFNPLGLFINVTILDLIMLPNGVDLGIPTILMLASLLIKTYRNGTFTAGEAIAIAVLTAMLTGAKAPFSVMVVGTLFGMFAISLFSKQQLRHNFKLLSIALVAFLAVYLPTMASGGSDSIHIAPGVTVLNTAFGSIIKKTLELFHLSNSNSLQLLLSNLATPFHFILFLPFVAAPFIFWFVVKIKYFKTIKQEELLIGGFAISGMCGYYLLSVDGNSQLYFIFGATAFLQACAFLWLFDNFNKLPKFFKTTIISLFIIASISSFSLFARTSFDGLRVAYSALTNRNADANPSINAITKAEYEGMIWLKKNVQDDEIIAADRHYSVAPKPGHIPTPNDGARYYYYSAYSGKQIFLEGWAYTPRSPEMRKRILERYRLNEEFYNPSNPNRVELMKANNIKYLVVSRFSHPGLRFNDPQLKMEFENADIAIYKLLD
ncbi:MAG: hypothetical protein C0410_08465 [Anaerolinea sp.]|nr:hypothetical protein [Anaerolinea sp.]